jgi:hypothetical protein
VITDACGQPISFVICPWCDDRVSIPVVGKPHVSQDSARRRLCGCKAVRAIAALYVETDGAYADLPGVDPWDIARDARNYAGPDPVVAHPPCSTWCALARLNEVRYGHRVGDDGGCFAHALDCVRKYGGVLEHPAKSLAWSAFGLLRPSARGGWQRALDGSWVCEVSQGAYGHRASKATWLYAVIDAPAPLDWSRPAPKATVSFLTNHGGGDRPRLGKKEARATPRAFRDALIAIARAAK